jgi:CPA1 family monovalent cation:H+ antiporter
VVEPADRITVEEAETRARIAQAALERLEELHHDLDVDDDRLEHLRHRYQHSIDHQQARRGGDHDQRDQQLAHLRHELLEAERAELLHLRDEPGISPAVFQRVLRDLDLEESRLDR